MRSSLKFILTTILFCCALFSKAQGAPKDSAVHLIQKLSTLYQTESLSEQVYLDTIYKTMTQIQSERIGFSNKELLELLSTYRRVIWRKNGNERFKLTYYAILSQQSKIEGRNGEMLYYAEQLNDVEQKISKMPSILSLNLMATYYNDKLAFPKSIDLYKKHQQFIQSIPQRVLNKQLERKDIMRSGDMLYFFSSAAYNAKDRALAQEIEAVLERLGAAIEKVYPADTELSGRFKFSVLMAEQDRYRIFGNKQDAWSNLLRLGALLDDPNTPSYLKGYINFHLVDQKTLFFLDTKQNDSARVYIATLNGLIGKESGPSRPTYMAKKYEARLLYNSGQYKESEDTLIKALEILEAAGTSTVSEVDEVMYALTKVEEQQLLLVDSAERQKESDRKFLALSLGSILLLGSAALVFVSIRRRQKARFLNFKLNLARNIHDETNPALLYAKMLAKEQRVQQGQGHRGALEEHIDHTMELIRGLSKDLKSEKQLLLADLVRDINELLAKMSVLSGFTYTLEEPKEKKRFLSHYQYANLKAILQECVANSIKHAEFKHIEVALSVNIDVLQVIYKDDGVGWEQDLQAPGIGLENMKERITKLNGDIDIRNKYPDGFSIGLKLKLS